MTAISLTPDGAALMRDGRTHVPLLDTVWNAFAEPTDAEWSEYLARRRSQGFTGLLISLLPTLHDRSDNPGSRMPFRRTAAGVAGIEEDYLRTARAMGQRAVDDGFTLFLVVLWSSYVPGTPASRMPPAVTLPADVVATLPALVHEYFADLEPVLLISGDDPFTDPVAIGGYRSLLHACRALMPGLLTGMHMWPDAVLPDHLLADPALDLTILQSGHTDDGGAKAIEIASRAMTEPVRPVINAEPCYEAHGHVRGHGRFDAAQVRRVAWTSLLAGASAGLGYGAHGVWQWHRSGSVFVNAEFSGQPLPWTTALALPGARDVAFAREVWESHRFAGARPVQALLDRDDDGARLARASDGRMALYLPAARQVRVAARVAVAAAWDLHHRSPLVPRLRETGDSTTLECPDVLADVVIILEER